MQKINPVEDVIEAAVEMEAVDTETGEVDMDLAEVLVDISGANNEDDLVLAAAKAKKLSDESSEVARAAYKLKLTELREINSANK